MIMLVNSLLRLLEVSIATSFLILPLCLASRRINRRYGAKWKYYIWLLLAVRLMIPVNLPAVNGFSILPELSQRQQIQTQEQPIQSQAHTGSQPETVPSQSQEQEQPISEPPYSIDGTKENTEAQPAAIMNVTDIAAIVWCIGFCVFSVFQLYVYYAFRRGIFVDGRECENNHIHELVVSTNHAIGLRRTMPVIVSRKVNSPMILGIFRPVLVIPREDYSSAECNMIVRHELTHCKRHDVVFKMLLTAVNALHWFNPFVYLMVREANADIELCCDADVLRNADSVQRKVYAESILTSMEREKGFVPVSTCFSNGGINKMKERLENIIDNGKRRKRRCGIVLLAVTIVMSVLLGAFVSCGNDVSLQDGAMYSEKYLDVDNREYSFSDIVTPVESADNSGMMYNFFDYSQAMKEPDNYKNTLNCLESTTYFPLSESEANKIFDDEIRSPFASLIGKNIVFEIYNPLWEGENVPKGQYAFADVVMEENHVYLGVFHYVKENDWILTVYRPDDESVILGLIQGY